MNHSQVDCNVDFRSGNKLNVNSKGNQIRKQKIAQMITFMKFLYHKSVKNKTIFNYGVGYR